MANTEDLSAETEICNRDNLKLWLCELTHLTPPQVDQLMESMEQKPIDPFSQTALEGEDYPAEGKRHQVSVG